MAELDGLSLQPSRSRADMDFDCCLRKLKETEICFRHVPMVRNESGFCLFSCIASNDAITESIVIILLRLLHAITSITGAESVDDAPYAAE